MYKILTSVNGPLTITNFNGSSQFELSGAPLGTVDGTATGELGSKVIVIGGSFADVTIGAVTQSGTWSVGVNKLNGVTPNLNKGASATGTLRVSLADLGVGLYETVAASQTAQVLGGTGATGDYIAGLLCVPANTSPGQVLLLDGATSITLFVGGASSVSNDIPFFIPLNLFSVSGAWKVTTGADISVIASGNFTA